MLKITWYVSTIVAVCKTDEINFDQLINYSQPHKLKWFNSK